MSELDQTCVAYDNIAQDYAKLFQPYKRHVKYLLGNKILRKFSNRGNLDEISYALTSGINQAQKHKGRVE
jgi:hypothetical protein